MEMFKGCKNISAAVIIAAALIVTGMHSPAGAQVEYEEIVVNLDVPRLVNADIFVQYDGSQIYIPVIEVFNLLELNVIHNSVSRKVLGYFIYKDNSYEIDMEQATVKSFAGEFELERNSYFYEGHEVFIRIDLFKTYFNLDMKFDFSKLKVSMPLNKDFPAYQRLERKRAQEKLIVRQTEAKKVHPLPFQRAWFQGGVADWTIATNPVGSRRIQYFSLNTGSMILGGDLNVIGTGNTQNGFDASDLRYRWHYFVNDNQYLTQVEAGKVYAGGRLPRAMDGAYFTNKPQIRRKFFQTINLSDFVGKGWEVELYIDNRLTDFTRTDESGEYSFNIDIDYGASLITLKKYGPNGEIRIEEQNIKVPYNLIPKNQLEYTTVIGNDNNPTYGGLYGQTNVYYGITSTLTTGLNLEIPLGADSSEGVMGAIDFAFQPISNLTFNGYAAPKQAINAGVNFTQPRIINFNASVTHYLSNGFRNLSGRENSINLSMSSPLKIGSKRISLRFNSFIDMFEKTTKFNSYYGFSVNVSRFYINYFGKYNISKYKDDRPTISDVSSQILISTSLIRWIRPQVRFNYDHSHGGITKYGIYLTKRVFKTGQLSISFERYNVNNQEKSNMFSVNFSIFSGFANFSSRLLNSGNQTSITQTQRGSIRYNQELHSFHFDRRAGVGQGSAVLRPFLDNNYNGRFDEGDEPVSGLTAKIKGANGKLASGGSVFYFDRLRAYDEYIIEINEYSLDNPLLKPVHEGYRMNFNPNMVTSIDVPIVMAGEVNGMIIRKTARGQSGLGGAKVVFINLSTGEKTEVVTFNNGEFYYLGLIPGRYRAQLDKSQLDRYGYRSIPENIDFEVEAIDGGAVVEDIDFILMAK